MKTSQTGIELIQSFEGLRLAAYLDAVGIPTIGYGTIKINGARVKLGMVCTKEQATSYLQADLEVFEAAINASVHVKITQEMFDALACFTYNLGESNLKSSTLLRLLNEKKYEQVPAQFLRWAKARGKVLPGLVKRRRAEAELFRSGIVNL